MKLSRRTVICMAGLAATLPAHHARAASAPVAFPANFRSGVLYNVVDREDRGEVHEQYTSREALEAARAGRPLPMGTVIASANYKARLDAHGVPVRDARGNMVAGELDRITVMEKRPGGGASYPEELRNGDWDFALFTADGRVSTVVPIRECLACHKPHRQLDYVKTYFAMAGKRVERHPTPVPAGAVVTTVVRFAVSPARVTLQAGTPVTWINADEPAHQFVVEGTSAKTDYLLKGQTGTLVLRERGTYRYHDSFYPAVESLQGVVEVR